MDVFLYDFNNTLHLSLSDGSDYDYPDVSQSFTTALDQSVQLFNNQESSFEWEIIPAAVLMTLFVCFHSYIMIFAGTKKSYSNKELEEVYSESTPKKDVAIDIYRKNVQTMTSQITICPYCGIESKKDQDGRCPNCGATL